MAIKTQLDQDLKTALLSGDKQAAMLLRGLKSAILYVEVEKGARDSGLTEEETTAILAKEAKKRQESADMYVQGGRQERADAELAEKALIEKYLPKQLNDEALNVIIEQVIARSDATGPQALGQIIGAVKQQTAGQADGGRIAALVKEKLA